MANLYKRYHEVFTSATTLDLTEVPAATTAIVRSIIVANTTGSSINISCSFSPLGSGTVVVYPTKALAANTYIDILAGSTAGPLILESTDILKVTSSASGINVTVSALLVDRS